MLRQCQKSLRVPHPLRLLQRVGSSAATLRDSSSFSVLYLPYPPSTHAAPGRVECNSLPSKILARSVPYCVVLPPSFDADKARHFPILYFLHGLGDNEQFLVHSGLWNVVEDMRDRHELKGFPDRDTGRRRGFLHQFKGWQESLRRFPDRGILSLHRKALSRLARPG